MTDQDRHPETGSSYTPQQASVALGVTPRQVLNLIYGGKLHATRVPGDRKRLRYRISEQALNDYLDGPPQ